MAEGAVDRQIAPVEEFGFAKDLRIVNDHNVLRMQHGSRICQTDQSSARRGPREVDLVPGMPGALSDVSNLDALEIKGTIGVGWRQNLPRCIKQRRWRVARGQQPINRFDHFGGIPLNACHGLR
ncbi:MAG: hypothetical protein WDN50_22435 [Bradyrhizobium sp.]